MHVSSGSTRSSAAHPLLAAQTSPLGDQLYFFFTQLAYEFHARLQHVLKEFDLSVRQYTTLGLIAGGHTPTQHELGRVLHLDPSQVVTLTKGLADRGLLQRQIVPTDRRARALVITADGKRLYQQTARVAHRVEEQLTAALSQRDRNALKSLLERVLPVS